MNTQPLNVIFLWHMHQPDYRDAEARHAMMPWVRLHGVKDYLDMVTILDDFPNVRQNFNLVPSLLDQLQGYVDGSLSDQALEITLKKADTLTVDDRIWLLSSFFHAHWDNMVKPYPRYWELLKMRGFHPAPNSLYEIQRYFSAQDILDLQVWYNLVWVDPVFQKNYDLLPNLIRRERNFTENDKLALIKIQREILSKIIPAYRSRQESGQIELSTTPYYHPILPLLYDTNLAAISQPNDPLPQLRFSHPEDVRTQINKAVEQHKFYFGSSPVGMWPSEGSVCQEIIPYFQEAGIKWIATDEGILANSIGRGAERNQAEIVRDPASWYRSFRVAEGRSEVDIIFRDHLLSDLIGFVYSHWNEQQAADNFIQRLTKIKQAMGNQVKDRAVAIILDGENAWEHYPGDGAPFLRELYGRLNDSSELKAVTISDYIAQQQKPAPLIKKIFPGSWINHNFRIWIGHQEDNLAWEYLGQARRALVLYEQQHHEQIELDKKLKESIKNAWEHIYIAEGSDWCWWYGDDHSSENDAAFDELFRKHLMTIYRCLGEVIPEHLHQSIIQADKTLHPMTEISSFINPKIDGNISSYYEWQAAAFYDVAQLGGAMHRSEYLVKEIFYGFNHEKFYLRIDIERKLLVEDGYRLILNIVNSRQEKVECGICYLHDVKRIHMVCENSDSGEQFHVQENTQEKSPICFALDSIFETAVSFQSLGLKAGDGLNFSVTIKQQDNEVQRIPSGGYLHFEVPGSDFEERMWYV
ncbi:MAG: alpha-amylase/alpha-mannosidase [Deltaproteobacteria bacterium]|nr:alpha-amylase/alpha-mannosidase [Candidatus Tharpella sp.]